MSLASNIEVLVKLKGNLSKPHCMRMDWRSSISSSARLAGMSRTLSSMGTL